MVEYKVEGSLLFIYVKNMILETLGKKFHNSLKTSLINKFWLIGIEMRKYSIWIFHTIIIALLMGALSGCGYKADPVYQKQQEKR